MSMPWSRKIKLNVNGFLKLSLIATRYRYAHILSDEKYWICRVIVQLYKQSYHMHKYSSKRCHGLQAATCSTFVVIVEVIVDLSILYFMGFIFIFLINVRGNCWHLYVCYYWLKDWGDTCGWLWKNGSVQAWTAKMKLNIMIFFFFTIGSIE